ncbi:uncharacterized protein DUF4198 [Primorskyibacter sedentarius]|uniref:Uncharacterized protein DUF4198 n=1 Tax=Primorskyibacter sedentarius TaxID=745311 RepID=A0A4R3J4F2_9RHOB|nr:DUF4198 domain-containing protein [Primorskyibacter sedentarius]TCS59636.1 uncharacterized protein DUF4198 [Primorskyibacter sedentarius]
MRMLALIAAVFPCAVNAHEFWISPLQYQIAADAPLVADIRVGEDFEGSAFSYLPMRFRRFDLAMGEDVAEVPGRAGDRPALTMPAPTEGLAVVIHVTTDSVLTYKEWEKFESFTTHKDFAWAMDRHRQRGLPDTGFKERYSRHGKSLIAVGKGAGSDKVQGLLLEIVARANPYTDDMEEGMPVTVFYDGTPRADSQIELFDKAPDGTVTTSLHRTDAQGQATIPVARGHSYLVDSVVMRAVDPASEEDPVWESLWASLTFAVPMDQAD